MYIVAPHVSYSLDFAVGANELLELDLVIGEWYHSNVKWRSKSHFFLKLSNKMRKRASRSRRPWAQRAERRKQSIFDFNHIDPHIQEEELEEIKNLFRFYHKRFWCLKRAHSQIQENESAHEFAPLPVWLQSGQLLEA